MRVLKCASGERLRRLMCNPGQQRRSPHLMLHQTLSKGSCRDGSGLLLLVSLYLSLDDWWKRNRSSGPSKTPPPPCSPTLRSSPWRGTRPVASLRQRAGLLAFGLGAPARILPEPLCSKSQFNRRVPALERAPDALLAARSLQSAAPSPGNSSPIPGRSMASWRPPWCRRWCG